MYRITILSLVSTTLLPKRDIVRTDESITTPKQNDTLLWLTAP